MEGGSLRESDKPSSLGATAGDSFGINRSVRPLAPGIHGGRFPDVQFQPHAQGSSFMVHHRPPLQGINHFQSLGSLPTNRLRPSIQSNMPNSPQDLPGGLSNGSLPLRPIHQRRDQLYNFPPQSYPSNISVEGTTWQLSVCRPLLTHPQQVSFQPHPPGIQTDSLFQGAAPSAEASLLAHGGRTPSHVGFPHSPSPLLEGQQHGWQFQSQSQQYGPSQVDYASHRLFVERSSVSLSSSNPTNQPHQLRSGMGGLPDFLASRNPSHGQHHLHARGIFPELMQGVVERGASSVWEPQGQPVPHMQIPHMQVQQPWPYQGFIPSSQEPVRLGYLLHRHDPDQEFLDKQRTGLQDAPTSPLSGQPHLDQHRENSTALAEPKDQEHPRKRKSRWDPVPREQASMVVGDQEISTGGWPRGPSENQWKPGPSPGPSGHGIFDERKIDSSQLQVEVQKAALKEQEVSVHVVIAQRSRDDKVFDTLDMSERDALSARHGEGVLEENLLKIPSKQCLEMASMRGSSTQPTEDNLENSNGYGVPKRGAYRNGASMYAVAADPYIYKPDFNRLCTKPSLGVRLPGIVQGSMDIPERSERSDVVASGAVNEHAGTNIDQRDVKFLDGAEDHGDLPDFVKERLKARGMLKSGASSTSSADTSGTETRDALPSCWVEGKDPKTGATYYYNQSTGESQWEVPDFEALISSPSGLQLPPVWEEAIDLISGREYYYNRRTNETSWEIPRKAARTFLAGSSEIYSSTDRGGSFSAVIHGSKFKKCLGCTGWGRGLVQAWDYCNHCTRVFSITIPQHVSPAAKRSAAATAVAAANVIEGDKNGDEHEAGFKHKWQADIAAAVGVDVMKGSKQKLGSKPPPVQVNKRDPRRKGFVGSDTLDPMDPSSYTDAPRGGWGIGLEGRQPKAADRNAAAPLLQHRPYALPSVISRDADVAVQEGRPVGLYRVSTYKRGDDSDGLGDAD